MKPLYTYLIGAVIFFTSLFFIFLWVLSDSGVGGIIKLYSLEQSVEETKVRIDSIVNLDENLELISGVEYYFVLDSSGIVDEFSENLYPEFKNDLKRSYSGFSYVIYSSESTKIIFRYKFVDLSLSFNSATHYGSLFKRARDINSSEKEKYIDIFDREIMSKIN